MKPVPTGDRFRTIALSLSGVIESAHMGHADFRVHDRIFATLAYEAKGQGTLKLTPEQQAAFLADAPELFVPVPGGWGRMGVTLVRLDASDAVLTGALHTAHQNILGKQKATKKRARKPKS